MSVLLIGQNKVLQSSDFLSATSQDGERWPAPTEKTGGNSGSFKVIASGTPTADSYAGTASGDGNAGGTTIVCAAMDRWGDDYWIGATVTISSGDCDGESQTVSDFAQATGTITVASAFTAQIASGVTFTITFAFSGLSFAALLIASGDAGSGTFDWYRDAATYLGRDNPYQATYLDQETIASSNSTAGPIKLLSLGEDGVLCFFSNADGDIVCQLSSVTGVSSWAAKGTLLASSNALGGVVRLSSGRILAAVSTTLYYSDDDGATWVTGPTISAFTGLAEISPNVVIGVYGTTSVSCKVSYDGGMTWGTAVTVKSTTGTQAEADIVLAENGDLVCVYYSDEDSVGSDEIKCAISTDHGATWGSSIAIINFSTDVRRPAVIRDLNGDLLVVADQADADMPIVMSKSTDNGATWTTGSVITVATAGSKDYKYPTVALVAGHEIWVAWCNDTDDSVMFGKRGIWEAYSANACPVPIEADPVLLSNGCWVTFYGGGGVAGDYWLWEADYEYPMTNLILDSPSKPWKSASQSIACEIIIDFGAYHTFYADAVAFFGNNLRTFSFQMNASNSWGTPSVDETIDFDLITGEVDAAITGNEIKDTSLLAAYDDHALKGYYLRFTEGNLDGRTYKIEDNVGEYLIMEYAVDFSEFLIGEVSVGDAFVIYSDRVAHTFTGGAYRFARISIASQNLSLLSTDGGVYKIGTMILGKSITLTDTFSIGYGKPHEYGITHMETPSGGRIPIKNFGRRRAFELGFTASEDGRKELVSLLDYMEGTVFALVLDSNTKTDCHLVHLDGPVDQTQVYLNKFALNVRFVEVL